MSLMLPALTCWQDYSPKGVKSCAVSHSSFLWFVFSIVFLLSQCGCRVATPGGIVCQHTIKARPATEDSISQG